MALPSQPRSQRSVVITGTGIASPLADSARDCVARICRGETCLAPLAGRDAAGAIFEDIPLEAIPAPTRARIGRLDRLCKLFLAATFRAVIDARLATPEIDAQRFGVSFGTGLGCLLTNAEFYERIVTQGVSAASPRLFAYTVSNAAAGEASIALGIKGPNLTAHAGLAAGAQAIACAADLIRAGKADVMLAGGADALGPVMLDALTDRGWLRRQPGVPFADVGSGISPSESAAIVVLEERAHAERRGAAILARLDSYALGNEPSLTRPQPTPRGIENTVRRAVAGIDPAAVGIILTSAQGSSLDRIELAALATVFAGHRPVLLAPKTAWGECFAGSGALAVAAAAELLRSAPDAVAGASYDLYGAPAPGQTLTTSLALVHTLCYSGPTVTIRLAREE